MIRLLVFLALPVALGGALLVMAQNRWGKAGRAMCLLLFVIGLYSGVALFTYSGVRAYGETCGLPESDPYYEEWGARESLLWPVMFLTGHTVPEKPCP